MDIGWPWCVCVCVCMCALQSTPFANTYSHSSLPIIQTDWDGRNSGDDAGAELRLFFCLPNSIPSSRPPS